VLNVVPLALTFMALLARMFVLLALTWCCWR